MQSFISKGKDVKEAIQLGIQIMEVSKNQVNIEILDEGSKGFIGIGSKKAVVKLSLITPSNNHENVIVDTESKQSVDIFDSMEKMVDKITTSDSDKIESKVNQSEKKPIQIDDLQGKVCVKDGQIFVEDSSTHFSTVTIGKGIKLIRNQQEVKEKTTIVTEKDHLQLKVLEDEEQITTWKVTLDSSKSHATLEVNPGYKIIRNIPDIEPDQHIEIISEETKEVSNTLTYEDVIEKLGELNVTYGIIQDEVLKAIKATEPTSFIVAKGKEAQQGKDGWIELKVDVETKSGLKEDESGKVDFREIKLIPTIEPGKIIAVVHPPIPGTPGITVTNEPLPAKQAKSITLKNGNGVTIVEDKIVATESGRPFIEKRGQFIKASVVPKLVHNDNVSLSSGNIRFSGDVEIRGAVEDNMVVEAGGDIVVFKSINNAHLQTSRSIITYGNVIGSELSSGKNNMLIAEIGHLLGNMHTQVENMITVINQLIKASAFKSNDFSVDGLQPLIRILLEKKFKSFLPLAEKYVEVTSKGKEHLVEEDWLLVAESIRKTFLMASNQITTVERLNALSQKMKELHEFSQIPLEPNCYITIPSAQNSKLYCSGNVLIVGKGCINTKVHSGGQLKISGVIRGGEVYGRLGITVNEVGSSSGTKTILSVPNDQSIQIAKAMEGTVLKIGNVKHILNQNRNNFIAKLNSDNQIIFE